jgi:rubredoxin
MSEDDTDSCPVCDEPLDGETTISSEGDVHEECAAHDPNVVVLPDGGRSVDGIDPTVCPNCGVGDDTSRISSESVIRGERWERWVCRGCDESYRVDFAPTEKQSLQPGTDREGSR